MPGSLVLNLVLIAFLANVGAEENKWGFKEVQTLPGAGHQPVRTLPGYLSQSGRNDITSGGHPYLRPQIQPKPSLIHDSDENDIDIFSSEKYDNYKNNFPRFNTPNLKPQVQPKSKHQQGVPGDHVRPFVRPSLDRQADRSPPRQTKPLVRPSQDLNVLPSSDPYYVKEFGAGLADGDSDESSVPIGRIRRQLSGNPGDYTRPAVRPWDH